MGGMFDVTHGAGLAAVWGSWARYVYRDCLHRFVRFAVNVMGVPEAGAPEETALKGIEAMEDFSAPLRCPSASPSWALPLPRNRWRPWPECALWPPEAKGDRQGALRGGLPEDLSDGQSLRRANPCLSAEESNDSVKQPPH